jgi:hypothetical protein
MTDDQKKLLGQIVDAVKADPEFRHQVLLALGLHPAIAAAIHHDQHKAKLVLELEGYGGGRPGDVTHV